jgi:hypothetical protein
MRNMTMMNPKNFEKVISTYFALKQREKEPFTIPGLALASGFSKTGDILNTLKESEEGESPYPKESIAALTRAVTRVEEHCLINGLIGKFPAPLTKFCLGAYHAIRDTNENPNIGVTQLSVYFSDDNQPRLVPHSQPPVINQQPIPLKITFDAEVDQLLAAL